MWLTFSHAFHFYKSDLVAFNTRILITSNVGSVASYQYPITKPMCLKTSIDIVLLQGQTWFKTTATNVIIKTSQFMVLMEELLLSTLFLRVSFFFFCHVMHAQRTTAKTIKECGPFCWVKIQMEVPKIKVPNDWENNTYFVCSDA